MLLGFSPSHAAEAHLQTQFVCNFNVIAKVHWWRTGSQKLPHESHRAKILGGNATKSSSSHHHNNNGFVEEPKRHLTIFSDSYAPNSQVSVRIKKKNSLRVTIYFIVCDKPHYVSKRWDDNLGISQKKSLIYQSHIMRLA